MTATMTATITAALDLQLGVIRAWLTPTIQDQCPKPDAAKLRVLTANLTEIRDRVAVMEGEAPAIDADLSAMMEALAEVFARHPAGMELSRAAIIHLVGLLNEAAAWSWAYQCHYRPATGQLDPARDPGRLADRLEQLMKLGGAA